MRLRRIGVAAIATVAAAMGTTVTTSVTALAPAHAATPKVVFGLIDHHLSDIDTDIGPSQLNMPAGTGPGILATFFTWDGSGTTPDQALHYLQKVRARGAVANIDLHPPTSVTLKQIMNGQQDAALKPWIQMLKSWGYPVMIRLFPEMNGRWESYAPYSKVHPEQTPYQFRKAYRHVFWLFRTKYGATNVRFVWCPDKVFKGSTALSRVWPGGGYVDWLGLDAYNFQDSAHGSYLPYYLVSSTLHAMRQLTGAANKPFLQNEIGCAPYSGKPDWIRRVPAAMQKLGAKAVVWFNEPDSKNWRLDSGPSAANNLAAARSAFVNNTSVVTYAGPTSVTALEHLVRYGS